MEVLLAHAGTVRLGDWEPSPLVLAASGIVLALFAQAFVRLRRRGRRDHAPWSRALLFGLAVAIGTVALVSPLDHLGEEYLLSGHMLQHVLIADLAPALALVALRGPLTFFLLPKAVLGPLARFTPLRWLLGQLLRPAFTFVAWAVVILAWHLPALYELTLRSAAVHDLEHALFVLVGVLAWTQLVDPARHERLRPPGRIFFALGLLVAGHPIVDGLFFDGSPAYSTYANQPHRVFGLSPLTDQRLAAFVMFFEQVLTLGTCAAILLWPYLRERRARRVVPLERAA